MAFLIMGIQQASIAQEIIHLNGGKPSGTETGQILLDQKTGLHTVYNVKKPTLTVYTSEASKANGSAVIICPGGAFHILDIDNEGTKVAEWFASRGFTAFILKYRLLPLDPKNPLGDIGEKAKDMDKFLVLASTGVPQAVKDGKSAMRYIKSNAAKWKIAPSKVGIIGFSAGGTLSLGLAYASEKEITPAFTASIYPFATEFESAKVTPHAPPLFIAAAEDDDFNFDMSCLNLYKKWKAAEKSVEMHIFQRETWLWNKKAKPSCRSVDCIFRELVIPLGLHEKITQL
ncbi:alpha/beta hydrolase [Pontibacter silvestris]|uniref:Alpha/beta hydrolase n=2 Tax=Pontibacter silvestris TaxID=2305183 RepID=A0ABW4WXJ3_9BACT|nr:alpha/beta hydrolase [Pontibacter silvestris]MCC9138459.1 alpha/beta hydrolase [Pontibacter silvestris]